MNLRNENMMSEFSVVESINDMHFRDLLDLLKQTWWAPDRPLEYIHKMLETCESFGLIDKNNKLVGYTRVLTDEIKYAYLYDVILDKSLRGRGLGKLLLGAVINSPKFKNIQHFELTCEIDMVEFYQQFGFSENHSYDGRDIRAMLFRRNL